MITRAAKIEASGLLTSLKATVGLLDQHYPDWRARLNEEVLIASTTRDVIGQVTGKPFFEADLSKLGYKPKHELGSAEEKLERRVWAGERGLGIPPSFEETGDSLFRLVPARRQFLEDFWNGQRKPVRPM